VQRRLLISMLAVAVVAVLLLGVPLGFLVVRQRTSEATQQVRHDATVLATGLQERVNAGLPPDADQVGKSLADRYVIIMQRGAGRTVVGTSPGPYCRPAAWPGRCRNWPARRTGSAPATPARWGAGTGCRNSTGWRNGWTGPRSGSTTC